MHNILTQHSTAQLLVVVCNTTSGCVTIPLNLKFQTYSYSFSHCPEIRHRLFLSLSPPFSIPFLSNKPPLILPFKRFIAIQRVSKTTDSYRLYPHSTNHHQHQRQPKPRKSATFLRHHCALNSTPPSPTRRLNNPNCQPLEQQQHAHRSGKIASTISSVVHHEPQQQTSSETTSPNPLSH